ncbi:MAG: hypothetical protein ABEK01_04860 [Candidatus Nanohaloarchaea archaeon]
MPFTPFHLGPAILAGLLLLRYIDFPTFLAANLMVDWRATLVFFGFLDGPLHSWPSTYPGAMVSAAVLGAVMVYIRPAIDGAVREAGIVQEISRPRIFAASFAGAVLHVTLDAFHHPNIQPFMVEGLKPLFGVLSTGQVYLVTLAAFTAGIPLYLLHASGMIDLNPDRSEK